MARRDVLNQGITAAAIAGAAVLAQYVLNQRATPPTARKSYGQLSQMYTSYGGSEPSAEFEQRGGSEWYARQIYVMRCVSIIGDTVREGTWKAYRDPERQKEIPNAPVLATLARPNPYQDGGIFLRLISDWLELHGQAYIYNAGTDKTPELYLLNADRRAMEVVPNERGFAASYKLHVEGRSEPILYSLKEITMIKRPTTSSSLYGASAIEALRENITTQSLAERTRRTFWLNDATPSGILSSKEAVDDDEAARQVKRWVKMFRGPDKKGKTAYLGGGVTYQAVAVPPDVSQWIEQHDLSVKDITVGFGVPLVLLDGAAANYATAREAKKTLIQLKILPHAGLIAQQMSRATWAGGVVLDLDYSMVEAMQADTSAVRADALKLLIGGGITLERFHEMIGEETGKDTDGNVYYIPNGITVIQADKLGVPVEPKTNGSTPGTTPSPTSTPNGDAGGSSGSGDAPAGNDQPADKAARVETPVATAPPSLVAPAVERAAVEHQRMDHTGPDGSVPDLRGSGDGDAVGDHGSAGSEVDDAKDIGRIGASDHGVRGNDSGPVSPSYAEDVSDRPPDVARASRRLASHLKRLFQSQMNEVLEGVRDGKGINQQPKYSSTNVLKSCLDGMGAAPDRAIGCFGQLQKETTIGLGLLHHDATYGQWDARKQQDEVTALFKRYIDTRVDVVVADEVARAAAYQLSKEQSA